MRRVVASALAVLLSCSAVAEAQRSRDRTPPGVQTLRRGQGIHGRGSPDGKLFAYWGRTGLEVYDLLTERARRVRVELGEVTCAAFGWSQNGRKLAFTHEQGVSEYDVAARSLRSVYAHDRDPHNRSVFCAVAYDHRGRVAWTGRQGAGVALFREGAPPTVLPPGFGAGRFSVVAFGPVSGARRLVVANPDTRLAVQLDLTHPRATFVPVPGGPFQRPYADRAGTRLCYSAAEGLACTELATGRVVVLGAGDVLGTTSANPFSPSGQRMIFNRDWSLVMHDFTTGEQRTMAPLTADGSVAYRGAAFQGDRRVLLFEHADMQSRSDPAVVRLDLTSGRSEVVLRDDQQHCYAEVVGEQTIFVFRTNQGGGEDLTRVRLPPL